MVKNPPANAEDIRDLGGFDPWVVLVTFPNPPPTLTRLHASGQAWDKKAELTGICFHFNTESNLEF